MALVRPDVSEEHIASVFIVKRLLALLVRSENVPHNGRGRKPLAKEPQLFCLPASLRKGHRNLYLLKMEAIPSSETWVLTRATRRHHISEDSTLFFYINSMF
jgi:hypothetical protein